MNKKNGCISVAILFLGSISMISLAYAQSALNFVQVNSNRLYSCTVTASNDPGIPTGSVTSSPLTLSNIESSGIISLNHGMIDLYGALTAMNAFSPSSGYPIFARMSGEFQGSVLVMPTQSGQLELDVAVTRMGRGYEPGSGQQVFLIANAIQAYKLICN